MTNTVPMPPGTAYRMDDTPSRSKSESEFLNALDHADHPYHLMATALVRAFDQAALGKGKERHANELPFEKQRMQTIADGVGSCDGIVFQACKKSQESLQLPFEQKQREVLGAIVYLTGAYIWNQRHND